MKTLIVVGVATGWLALNVATALAPSGDVNTYVAVDADHDGTVSVGDTIGWNVDGPQVVTLRCWSDEKKTKPVQQFVSPPYNPKASYEPTGKSVVLLSPGYCESTGSAGGLHWFTVEPFRMPAPWITYP